MVLALITILQRQDIIHICFYQTKVFIYTMSQITIQCRLVASEPTRQHLWKLMAQANTPLINELLKQVGQHPDFEAWRHKGKLPAGIVKQLCQPLRTDPRFIGQPGRFYMSA
jgi:hypothetical protein